MAATWEISITVTNMAEKRIHVSGTRTDGEESKSYSLATLKRDDETKPELWARVAASLRALVDDDAASQTNVDALIETAETDIAAILNAEEV